MCVKFSNLTMVPGDAGGEPPVSVAAVAARQVDRLQLLEIELDDMQRPAGCHALRRGKGLDQSAANSRPQNLHSRAVAIIGSLQYGQGARSSAAAVPGFMHAQASAATHPNKVQPRSRLRTKMAPRL